MVTAIVRLSASRETEEIVGAVSSAVYVEVLYAAPLIVPWCPRPLRS